MTSVEIDKEIEGVEALADRVAELQRELETARTELANAVSQGSEASSEVGRVRRGLMNLSFEADQRQKELETRLDLLETTLTGIELAEDAPAPAPLPAPAPTSAPAPADASEAVDARELKALRAQVAELQRAVSEVRGRQLRKVGRRQALKRGVTAPFRLVAAPFRRGDRPQGGASAKSRKRRPLKVRLRRMRLRMLRFVRRNKARVRNRFFARRLGRLNHHDPKPMKLPRRYRKQIELRDPPVISIVTPSYNQGHFLDRTIHSVIDQDYPRLEYIVQDGGSTDDSAEVLERNAERLHHYEMRDDDGHAHAINLGFQYASGEVMAFLNSDDLLLPGSLHYVGRYFERHPEVDAVYGHRVLVDENDMEIGRWVMPPHDDEVLSWADFVPQETLFWRRDIWERAGGFMDQEWPFALDWDLLIRLRDAGANMVRLPRFLGAFRIHEAQKTSAIMDTQGQDEATRLRKRMHGRDVTRQEITQAVKPYLRRHHVRQKLYRVRLLRY